MSLITTIIDGIAPNPSSGLGGANEGHIQGFQDDIINGIVGGVADKTGGQCLVTQNSPLGMSVLVANGVVYIPNSDYIANLATATKFYRVIIKDEDPVTIPSNTSGSDCQHGLDVVIDKDTVPNEYGSNIASLVVTLGTPGAGAPAVPDNGYRLAEVEVVNGATQIANVSITDTRTQIAINDVVLSTNVVTKTATQTLSQKTLTSPVINTSFSGTAKATASEVATGTNDTKIVTPLSAAAYGNSSMARQALINPNFDVFQRTAFASKTSSGYCLDHWYAAVGGTVTITQETTGVPVGSTYVARVTYNAASSFANLSQALELVDAKKLWGKTVTATVKLRKGGSFAANIALKIQKNATGDTMTGGSWSDIGLTTIANASLPTGTTSTDWVTATCTVTVPTDGSANGLRVTIGESAAGGNAEYYEASQVQLCAGDVALPFQPKSYAQELLDCQRYTVDMLGGSALANIIVATGECNSATRLYASIQLPVTMRIAPTIVAGTASNFLVGYWTGANIACTAMSLNIATPQMVLMNFDVAGGLTANYPARIFRPGTTEKLLFTAEL